MCSPQLLKRKPLGSPDDLGDHTLLHVHWRSLAEGVPNWGMWLKAAGARGVDPAKGPRFTDGNLALQAAAAGQGVALVDEALARDHFRDGRLVRPFAIGIAGPGRFAFSIVGPELTWRKPKVRAFREWLLADVRASHAEVGADCHA